MKLELKPIKIGHTQVITTGVYKPTAIIYMPRVILETIYVPLHIYKAFTRKLL